MPDSATSASIADGVTVSTPPAAIPLEEQQVLFWDSGIRGDRFTRMEDYFGGLEIAPPRNARELPRSALGLSAELSARIATYLEETGTVGIVVLKQGQLRHSRYRASVTSDTRWTSASVAKSFTSTLLGAAVRDGFVDSLDDPVVRYIPGLGGSAYDGVTVRQLATMTSGVEWTEDYTDPDSDVARMLATPPQEGEDQTVVYMRTLERSAVPGEKWAYKTGETNLLGILVENATGETLAQYAKRKIVDPAGFSKPMFWMTDLSGRNIGGCCVSLTLPDYARFGQWVLEGADGVVPDGWFEEAGRAQVALDGDRFGYGYQWWTYSGKAFGAQGIFGQSVAIFPDEQVVVAMIGNWPSATSRELSAKRRALVEAIAEELAAD